MHPIYMLQLPPSAKFNSVSELHDILRQVHCMNDRKMTSIEH